VAWHKSPMSGDRTVTSLRFLPFLLLAVPLTEIALFILIGGLIGVLPTIAIVLATAVTGAFLLRTQGLRQLELIRRQLATGQMPGREIANGAMLLVAGVLLLTPGFLTDTLGFLLFVPRVRDRLYRFIAARVRIMPVGGADDKWPRRDGTIELDADAWREERR
jgi:UPF0716 protein FxsA